MLLTAWYAHTLYDMILNFSYALKNRRVIKILYYMKLSRYSKENKVKNHSVSEQQDYIL